MLSFTNLEGRAIAARLSLMDHRQIGAASMLMALAMLPYSILRNGTVLLTTPVLKRVWTISTWKLSSKITREKGSFSSLNILQLVPARRGR